MVGCGLNKPGGGLQSGSRQPLQSLNSLALSSCITGQAEQPLHQGENMNTFYGVSSDVANTVVMTISLSILGILETNATKVLLQISFKTDYICSHKMLISSFNEATSYARIQSCASYAAHPLSILWAKKLT